MSSNDVEETKSRAAAALETALDSLGPFGLYQRYMVVMLCIPNLLAAMYSLNYVFVADQVPYRCVVPECEGTSSGISFVNETVSALLPLTADTCHRYQPLPLQDTEGSDPCSSQHYHPVHTTPCEHFVYENYDTIYAEFDLACREWKRTLVGTIRNTALPLALILTGYISDNFGRRTAFCIFASCAGVLGVVKSFSVNYQMFVAMEFFEAALGYGFNSAAYVMMIEVGRPSLRGMFACATGVAYGAGGVAHAWLARSLRHWRHLLRATHALALLLPLYWLLIDESVRWLHAAGSQHRAERVLRKAARWNKVTLDEEVMKNLYVSDDRKMYNEHYEDKEASTGAGDNPWMSLLKSGVLMRRMSLCAWCWIAVAFVYYGLTINSVSLSGDKYVNFALNMAMEIVASLLLMMSLERFGRKWSIFVAFLLSGVACVTPFFISDSGTTMGMFFLGKLSITFAFNSIYIYTAELFPTRVRSSALAACSLIGRIGSVLAPQTPLLSVSVQAGLYGACCASAGVAVLAAPETRRAPLPADVRAAETLRPTHTDHVTPQPPPPPPTRVISADT